MGRSRGRVAPMFISNERSRMRTFLTRSKGLVKKSMELSALCRINVCMICLGPSGSKAMLIEPVTWPQESSKVQEMIQDYQSRSVAEKDCRKSDLLGFLEGKKRKLEKEYDRLKKHAAGKLHSSWDPRLDDYSEEQLREIVMKIDSKLAVVKHAIEFREGKRNPSFPSSASNEESRTLIVQNQAALISEEQVKETIMEIDPRNAIVNQEIAFQEGNTYISFPCFANREESRALAFDDQQGQQLVFDSIPAVGPYCPSQEPLNQGGIFFNHSGSGMEIGPRNAIVNQEIAFPECNTYHSFPCSAHREESKTLIVDHQQGQLLHQSTALDSIPAVGPCYPVTEPLNQGGIFFNHTGSGTGRSPNLVYSEAATNYNFLVTPAATTHTSNWTLGFSALLQNNMEMNCCSLDNQCPIASTSSIGTPLLPHLMTIPYPFTAQRSPMQQADAIPSLMNQNNYGWLQCNYSY